MRKRRRGERGGVLLIGGEKIEKSETRLSVFLAFPRDSELVYQPDLVPGRPRGTFFEWSEIRESGKRETEGGKARTKDRRYMSNDRFFGGL